MSQDFFDILYRQTNKIKLADYVLHIFFSTDSQVQFRLDKWIVIIVCVCIVDSIDFFFHKPLMKGPSFFTTRHINFTFKSESLGNLPAGLLATLGR